MLDQFSELTVAIVAGVVSIILAETWRRISGWVWGQAKRLYGWLIGHIPLFRQVAIGVLVTSLAYLVIEQGNVIKSKQFVAGTILPYVGDSEAVPTGWVICGKDGTPDLGGYFLVGTNDLAKVGDFTGSENHGHHMDFQSSEQSSGRFAQTVDGADNHTGRNWQHQHRIIGPANVSSHVPPSVQVLFLCRENSN